MFIHSDSSALLSPFLVWTSLGRLAVLGVSTTSSASILRRPTFRRRRCVNINLFPTSLMSKSIFFAVVKLKRVAYKYSKIVFAVQVWLPAAKGKGLELSGTFSRKNSTVCMELTLTNRAMQPMMGFAVQFNKNR